MAPSRTKAGYAKSAYPIVKLKNKMLILCVCVCVCFISTSHESACCA